MDWLDVDPPEKAIGAFHATLNTSATVLFLASFLIRWGQHWQPGWGAFAVALAGYLLVMGGGYLGGKDHGLSHGSHDLPQRLPERS